MMAATKHHKAVYRRSRQRGAVLVVAMLFLLVVTVISVVAAGNSTFSLKMSSNLQDSYDSFQSAEAGVNGIMFLVGTSNDAFDRTQPENLTPFANVPDSSHPLRNLNGGTGVMDVDVFLTAADRPCPRDSRSSTDGITSCDYYRIDSEHDEPQRARTKVNTGVVKTILGGGVN